MSGILGSFGGSAPGKITQLRTDTDSHIASTGTTHGAVSAATVNQIMTRDSSGRVDVVAPPALDSTTKVVTSAWVQTEIAGGGTVTSVGSGVGLTGGPITGSGTLDMANTAVTPATYTLATLTVDAQGRLTAASNGSIPIASETVQGIVERATQAEVDAGTDTTRFISPARLQAKVATETALGIVERATQAEVDAGTDTTRYVAPVTLGFETGSFVVTYQGYAGSPTTTWNFTKIGQMVIMSSATGLSDTSNSTSLISTAGDVPVSIRPTISQSK